MNLIGSGEFDNDAIWHAQRIRNGRRATDPWGLMQKAITEGLVLRVGRSAYRRVETVTREAWGL